MQSTFINFYSKARTGKGEGYMKRLAFLTSQCSVWRAFKARGSLVCHL